MNKEQKRKIIGVAVISGVILVSVASAGTVKLVREANATEANKYITAQSTHMNSTINNVEINGITYSLDTSSNIATVTSIVYDNATCAYSPNTNVFSINIPESISYNSVSYTVKYLGNDSDSVFSSGNTSITAFLNNKNVEKLVVILNKSITEVRSNSLTNYKSTGLKELRVVALSNEITFKTSSIHTKISDGLYANVVTVPGTDTSAIKNIEGVTIVNLYNIETNGTNKTAVIKGFTDGAVFDGVCDANSTYINGNTTAALCNIKIPDKVTINGTEYIVNEIANNAFSNKARLKNVIIPATVTKIGSNAFSNSSYLNYLVFLGINTNISSNILDGSTFEKIYALTGSTAESFCKSKDSSKLATINVYSIRIDKKPSKLTYKVGDSVDLSGANIHVSFTATGIYPGGSIVPVSDLKIIDPASGKFDTVGNKNVIIAHKNDINDTKKRVSLPVSVVSDDINVSGVEINCSDTRYQSGTITINKNDVVKFEANINPTNATNKKVTWKSDNTDVATIDENGNVTGKSGGTATITVTTADGNKTATAKVTVIEDTTAPVISSVKGEKDSNGIYKVIIKVTDDTGVEKILVNGEEITTKDDEGNYYFIPTQNGEYKIEAYDKAENKAEYIYTENNVITETKITPDKDSEGNNIIYIETITNKDVDNVKVNGTEITEKDEEGRYCFKPSGNGTYTIDVTYKDGTTERKTYNETRFTEDNGNNSGNNNNGNSGNNGNSSNGTNENKNNLNNTGTDNTSGKTGNTISTSTALTELPKTGSTMGALFAAIASGISAIFAWFKQKRQK